MKVLEAIEAEYNNSKSRGYDTNSTASIAMVVLPNEGMQQRHLEAYKVGDEVRFLLCRLEHKSSKQFKMEKLPSQESYYVREDWLPAFTFTNTAV